MRFSALPILLLFSATITVLAAPHPLQPSTGQFVTKDQLNLNDLQKLAARDQLILPNRLPHDHDESAELNVDFDGKQAGFLTKIFDKVKNIFKSKPKVDKTQIGKPQLQSTTVFPV